MNFQNYLTSKVRLNEKIPAIKFPGIKFNVNYWGAIEKHYNTTLHEHSFYEVFIVTAGTGSYLEEHHTYPLKPNTLLITLPNKHHQILSETGLSLLYLGFSYDQLSLNAEWEQTLNRFDQLRSPAIYLDADNDVQKIWDALTAASLATSSTSQVDLALLENLTQALILAFITNAQTDEHAVAIAPDDHQSFIKQVTDYVKDNLTTDLSLQTVADSLYLSPRSLSRTFSETAGITFSQFVQNLRLEAAVRLLKTTDLPIGEVSDQCGYSSIYYFSRIFMQHIGDNPSDFRKLYTNQAISKYATVMNDQHKSHQIIT